VLQTDVANDISIFLGTKQLIVENPIWKAENADATFTPTFTVRNDGTSNIALVAVFVNETEINFYNCSLFDDEKFRRILGKEGIEDKCDFVLVSKTLHHLRTGRCIAKGRDQKHECQEDEECCIYKFEEQEIFKRLSELGKRVIVYECFHPHDKDDDKIRGRGGYFTIKEWRRIFSHLSENYRVEFIEPLRCHLDQKEVDKVIAKLRQVDCVCFYLEMK